MNFHLIPKIWKEEGSFLAIFEASEIGPMGPLELNISDIKIKFKNRLGDVNCTWISFNPHPQHAPELCAVWALRGGAGVFAPSTPTIPA